MPRLRPSHRRHRRPSRPRAAGSRRPQPPPPFPQGAKVGLVNLQQIASLSVEGKASTARVQALITKKQTEAAAKAKALQDNQTKLQQGGALLNDAARAQLEKDIERQTGRNRSVPAGRAGRNHRAADPAAGRLPAEAVPGPQSAGAGERAARAAERRGRRRHHRGSGDRSDARSDQALRRGRIKAGGRRRPRQPAARRAQAVTGA